MIEAARIKELNNKEVLKKTYVLYWMQASQRSSYNHALEYTIAKANELKKPVLVYFGVTADYPGANARHYSFMLEGLKQTKDILKERGINLVILKSNPPKGAIELAKKACMVITDRGYTRLQKAWRIEAAHAMDCALYQVESDVVVPVEETSPKEEYAAATIRRKLLGRVLSYLNPVKAQKPEYGTVKMAGLDITDTTKVLKELGVNQSVQPSSLFKGGETEALRLLRDFIKKRLKRYSEDRSDPSLDCESHLSPYLHFGQISPLQITMEMLKAGEGINGPFLEELIIRRELAINFVSYNKHYDSFECLPSWAKQTLRDHESDIRPYRYSAVELEEGKTHDPYWNAAQIQMVKTGKMHNYMRMYWGKKVIEWSQAPEMAYKTLIYLNDKYELDGRDPNGYAGIAWCFGKHDRAWTEREIFGKIRYMNAKGLERKFGIKEYAEKWL